MTDNTALIVAVISACASAAAAILAVIITSMLSRGREREADWRKLKLAQYQEYILALSGVVRERATPDAHRRYADAVNSMNLVAPVRVLAALQAFQKEISYLNGERSDHRHDLLLDDLIRAMRNDIHSGQLGKKSELVFRLLSIPPEAVCDDPSPEIINEKTCPSR